MNDESKPIPVSPEQAGRLVPLLRDEAARLQANGDALIFRTNSHQAGFNSYDAARSLLDLADLLDLKFPDDDEDDDDGSEHTTPPTTPMSGAAT